MKTSVATTQFDQPNLMAAPATPSCCCCCCCCLATIVSTAVIAGTTVNVEANLTGSSRRAGALILALGGQFVGFGLFAAVLWLGLEWPYAILAGLGGAVVCWYTAFGMSGGSDNIAIRRALTFTAVYAVAFSVEFVVGAVLVILYVIPYLIAALFIGTWVTRNRLAKIRLQAGASMNSPHVDTLDANFLMDAPPTGPLPAAQPRRSVADQPLPGSPKK